MSIESRLKRLEQQNGIDAPADDEPLVTIDGGAGYRVSVPQSAMEKCMPMIEKIYGTPSDGDGQAIPERIAA